MTDTKFSGERFNLYLGGKGASFIETTFSEARFTFANFSKPENEVSFKGTRFEEKANFL